MGLHSYAELDESSALETNLERREVYAQSKIVQETLVRQSADQGGLKLTLIRPGAIYGRDNLWTGQLGIRLGERRWLRFTGVTKMPLTYVENCAAAVVLSAESEAAIGKAFYVLDDDLPSSSTTGSRRASVGSLMSVFRVGLIVQPSVFPKTL